MHDLLHLPAVIFYIRWSVDLVMNDLEYFIMINLSCTTDEKWKEYDDYLFVTVKTNQDVSPAGLHSCIYKPYYFIR